MSFLQKLGIMAKYWDPKEAPAITFIFRIVVLAILAAIVYGLWRVFG